VHAYSSEEVLRQMERTDISSCGLGNKLERRISISKDQYSKQTITVDGTTSLRKLLISYKSSLEKDVHVFLHAGENVT
jgi:hypothetical protein